MTYGIPYTMSTDLGDLSVMTVDLGYPVPDGYTSVVIKGGPIVLVPTAALTAVDTTPPEPEPGAYLIAGVLCVSFTTDYGNEWTSAFPDGDGDTYIARLDWAALWKLIDVSDARIVRLVPATPDVNLPWRGEPLKERNHVWADVVVARHAFRREVVTVALGATVAAFSPDAAERFGFAVLSAARAAREVAP